jgi:lipoyl(octanoyl) transferase
MITEWKINQHVVPYLDALNIMEQRVEQIITNQNSEMIWLLEHPPLYTAGTSAKTSDLLQSNLLPVYKAGRGGQYTYHGPGQRVMYLMLDLKKRTQGNPDLKQYVYNLEQLIIESLIEFGIKGERKKGRVGIWVIAQNSKEEKIAAIGIRVKKWVTYHGIAINVNPNLEHFNGIVPCGIKNYGVSSIEKLNKEVNMNKLDYILKQKFDKIFG